MLIAERNAMMVSGTATAKSYITRDPIAIYDGLENAGYGVHDSTATAWTDLSGNGKDMTLYNGALFDVNCLRLTGLVNNKWAFAEYIGSLIGRLRYTIEVCFVGERTSTYNTPLATTQDDYSLYTSGNIWTWKNPRGNISITDSGTAQFKPFIINYSTIYSYDVVPDTFLSRNCRIGGTSDRHALKGSVFAIRLNAGNLTQDELRYNRQIDMLRFPEAFSSAGGGV